VRKQSGGFPLNRNIVLQIALGASLLALATLRPALAADDEIMVTDGDLAKVRTPELEVHINFSRGSNQSPGEGVVAPKDVLRVTPELSIGAVSLSLPRWSGRVPPAVAHHAPAVEFPQSFLVRRRRCA
jgi:hypothetical protein